MTTPQKDARELLTELGVTPSNSKVKKILPISEVRRAVASSSSKVKKGLFKAVQKKKGLLSAIARAAKMSRKTLAARKLNKKTACEIRAEMRKKKITEFLQRPDNSYMLSEKRYAGRYSLTDTMNNLLQFNRKK